MTNRIAIHEPIDALEFHKFATELVTPSDFSGPPRMSISEKSIWNEMGQGLDSLLWTDFTDNPVADPEEYNPAPDLVYAELHIDTPYSCKVRGMSCGTWQAYLISEIANKYLIPNGFRFSWYDESGDTWNRGVENLEALVESGHAAASWFQDIVVPALPRMIEEVTSEPLEPKEMTEAERLHLRRQQREDPHNGNLWSSL
jgi:hypothetical protein